MEMGSLFQTPIIRRGKSKCLQWTRVNFKFGSILLIRLSVASETQAVNKGMPRYPVPGTEKNRSYYVFLAVPSFASTSLPHIVSDAFLLCVLVGSIAVNCLKGSQVFPQGGAYQSPLSLFQLLLYRLMLCLLVQANIADGLGPVNSCYSTHISIGESLDSSND